jgi:hypothetical protein
VKQQHISLIDTLTDRRLNITLPGDVPLEQLIPALARKLGLSEGDYALTLEGADAALALEATLVEAGVGEGSTLRLERTNLRDVRAESPQLPKAPSMLGSTARKKKILGWTCVVLVILALCGFLLLLIAAWYFLEIDLSKPIFIQTSRFLPAAYTASCRFSPSGKMVCWRINQNISARSGVSPNRAPNY